MQGDAFCFVHYSGSTFTLVAITSRFQLVTHFSADQPWFVTLICSFYCLAFVSICVHCGCLCLLRIACLKNLNFIEESVGEARVRGIMIGLSIFLAFTACTVQVISGDISSGTAYVFLTRSQVKIGNAIL